MIEEFDIITLANGKKYTVVKTLTYNSKEYLYLMEVNDDEDVLEEQLIVEKVPTAKGYGVKNVEDINILQIVGNKFKHKIYDELDI